MRRPLALLALAAGLAVAGGCGGDEPAAEEGAPPPAETPAAPEDATDGCRLVEAPEPRPEGTGSEPDMLLDPDRTYEVAVTTNCGEFTITLDQAASPEATASFVSLVETDFYDETIFHRIVPGFVIQGGDPTATGMGGPGYRTEDTPAEDTLYIKGVVAMAKTAEDPPGTAGSQFFIVTAPDASLPPEYAVIGTVTEGVEVVDRIAVLGDPATELPTQPVVVEQMEVRTR